MEAITNWATGSTQPGSSEREYRFSVGKKYEGKGGGFFYRNLDSIGQYGGDEQFQFSVAQLPDGLDEPVREAQSVDKGLALVLAGKERDRKGDVWGKGGAGRVSIGGRSNNKTK